jgi:hypothetical protein
MKRILTGCLLAASWLALPGALAAEEEIERLAKRAGWLMDYPTARAAARQTGKPLFVVFRCQP